MKGACGKILHVDLSRGKFSVEVPEEAFYRKYMGGSAVGAYYALKMTEPGIDAFDPGNVLVFAASVTTGTPISGSSRFNVTAKSPLTGGLGDSQGGGFWGTELKYAGFDAVVITGRATKPVALWIHDGEYELVDAERAWGLETGAAQEAIRAKVGDAKARVAVIGPAGERLVRFACITNELKHYNGRNGMGAVMGSKNLKAIAVRGTLAPEFADLEGIMKMARDGAKRSVDHPHTKSLREHGTARGVANNQVLGGLPTRNWTSGVFEGYEKITGTTMTETILKSNGACWACAVRCKRVVEAKEPYELDPEYGGPEYETVAALGSYLGIDDLPAVAKAAELCNRYGIDTISAGGTIAFAMECFEKGILSKDDVGGLDLRFGSAEALIEAIKLIAGRKGLGDLLAEGAYRAAAKIGKGAEKLAVCCKKQEFPAHMPRIKGSLALAYAVNPFGADHMSSNHDGSLSADPLSEAIRSFGFEKTEPMKDLDFEKAKLVAYTQRFYSVLDTLDLCMFCFGINILFSPGDVVSLVNMSTGWDVNHWELMKLGERRINMLRAFNFREGFTKEDDSLPARAFEPLKGGPSDGNRIDERQFDEARRSYYELMGWDPKTGKPPVSKLMELGLDWLVG